MTAASTLSTRKLIADCRARGVCCRCPRRAPLPVYKSGYCRAHYAAQLAANARREAARRAEKAAAPVVETPAPTVELAAPPPARAAPTLPAWLSGDTSRLPRVAPPLRRPT